MHSNKVKVTVVQLVTPNIDSYAIFSILSINHYCKIHGYKHFLQRHKSVKDKHINWSKIDLLQKAFEFDATCDYILLVDADTIITEYEKSVEFFLDKFAKPNTEIIMPQDTPLKITLQPRPNAGFVLVKNSTIGRSIISDWIAASVGKGKHVSDIHPRNQRVYWYYVMNDYLDVQIVLPRWYFQKPLFLFGKNVIPSKFLYHVTSSSIEERIKTMKQMCLSSPDISEEELTKLETTLQNNADYLEIIL